MADSIIIFSRIRQMAARHCRSNREPVLFSPKLRILRDTQICVGRILVTADWFLDTGSWTLNELQTVTCIAEGGKNRETADLVKM